MVLAQSPMKVGQGLQLLLVGQQAALLPTISQVLRCRTLQSWTNWGAVRASDFAPGQATSKEVLQQSTDARHQGTSVVIHRM